MNLEKTCRLCAVSDERFSFTNLSEHPLLLKKIETLFPIKVVNDDSLPIQVCSFCLKQTEESFTFYANVCAAERRLRLNLLYVHDDLAAKNSNHLPTLESVRKEKKDPDDEVENLSFTCPHCSKVFETKGSLRAHVRTDHVKEINTRKYRCRVCLLEFTTASKRDAHHAVHSKERPFLCQYCGKSFKVSCSLRTHLRTHASSRKRYPCQLCEKTFLTRFFLKEHQNKHLGRTPYKCNECGKAFHAKIHLRQHRWTHAGGIFQCAFCSHVFNRKSNMAAHVKEFHLKVDKIAVPQKSDRRPVLQSKPETSTLQEKLICKKCKKIFTSSQELMLHRATHVDNTECHICGKEFKHHGSLTYHRRIAHTGDRPYKCIDCGSGFALQSQLSNHERRVHTGERPYKCQNCSRCFFSANSLRCHMAVHVNGIPFTCEVCGRGFRRKGSLTVHLKGHVGLKDHACSTCDKRFMQKNDLIKHREQHNTDNLPFFCKFCGDSFAKRSDLTKHRGCRSSALDKAREPSPEQMLNIVAQQNN